MRIAVIGGGRSAEHDVSLASAAGVADALDARHDVVRITVGRDGEWPGGLSETVALLQTCDVAFPMLHGRHGEDGTIAALLDLASVPHVGSGVRAGALAMDKWVTKLIAEDSGIRTAAGVLVRRGDAYDFRHPVVVKPVTSGSSYGVSIVREASELPDALDAAYLFDDRVLIEDVVHGREMDVAIIRHPGGIFTITPPLEIVAAGIFDHDTKYDGSAQFVVPAQLTAVELHQLETAALTMYDGLGCAGVARVDFFLTDDGPVLNEVNTLPGFTPRSQVPRMFVAAGIDYLDLLELLAADAFAASPARIPAPRSV